MNFKVDNIGEYLKKSRKDKKLTLNDVALLTNLSLGYISRIERGSSNLTKDTLDKLVKVYNINMSEIIEGYVDEENIRSIDVLDLISEDYITFKGKTIDLKDKVRLNYVIKLLLEVDDEEIKDNIMNIIKSVECLIK